MAKQNLRDVLLNTARSDFPVFYMRASARETKIMDMMVLLTALFVRLHEPSAAARTPDSPSRRDETNAAAHTFTQLKSELQNSRIFPTLPTLERQKIQRVIFDRVPSAGGSA